MPLTGYEETSVVEVGAVLDDTPADAEEVYLRTMDYSERAIAAVAAKRAGSSSTQVTGFAVHENSTYEIDNGMRWHPDTIDFASGWDTTDISNGRFTVETGSGGLYQVEAGLTYEILTGGPADEVWADIVINSTLWNVDPISFDLVSVSNAISADTWRGYGSAMLPLADGCIVSVEISRHPFIGLSAQVVPISFFRAFRIGDDPSFH